MHTDPSSKTRSFNQTLAKLKPSSHCCVQGGSCWGRAALHSHPRNGTGGWQQQCHHLTWQSASCGSTICCLCGVWGSDLRDILVLSSHCSSSATWAWHSRRMDSGSGLPPSRAALGTAGGWWLCSKAHQSSLVSHLAVSLPPLPYQREMINFHTHRAPQQLCLFVPRLVVGGKPTNQKGKKERKGNSAGRRSEIWCNRFQAVICICRDLPEHSSYTWAHRKWWLTINLLSPEERCFSLRATHKSNAVGSCKTTCWTTLTSYLCSVPTVKYALLGL